MLIDKIVQYISTVQGIKAITLGSFQSRGEALVQPLEELDDRLKNTSKGV